MTHPELSLSDHGIIIELIHTRKLRGRLLTLRLLRVRPFLNMC